MSVDREYERIAVDVRSIVVELGTSMRVVAGSNPAQTRNGVDRREELI